MSFFLQLLTTWSGWCWGLQVRQTLFVNNNFDQSCTFTEQAQCFNRTGRDFFALSMLKHKRSCYWPTLAVQLQRKQLSKETVPNWFSSHHYLKPIDMDELPCLRVDLAIRFLTMTKFRIPSHSPKIQWITVFVEYDLAKLLLRDTRNAHEVLQKCAVKTAPVWATPKHVPFYCQLFSCLEGLLMIFSESPGCPSLKNWN